jgi:glycosyltransferase involved in cell wall biosynthesis
MMTHPSKKHSIVFGSSNHWTSPYQVGSHAWARMFANHQWYAAYISDPVTPWHGLERRSRERTQERFALWRSGGQNFEEGRIRAWTPFSLIASHSYPIFRSRLALDYWDRFTIPDIQKKLTRWGFDSPEILWLDSVRHAEWGRRLSPRCTVLRIADWTPGFSSVPQSVIQKERELIQEADLVITSASSLEEKIRPWRGDRPICTIRNGVDASFWSQPMPVPPEYANIPSPRAIYVGALDEWFDLDLLLKLAKALPKVSFVMVGQCRLSGGAPNLPNLYWLGSRTRELARAYVQHAHVGIIPFKRTELIECVCPLKLYEYMLCGLPVVATQWQELKLMNSPAHLATSHDEWIELVRQLTHGNEENSSATNESERVRSYAAKNDWQHRWAEWETAYESIVRRA